MSEANTKARLLFLEHYLIEHTDENHKVTTEELIGIYQQSGNKANRNTIRDDIEPVPGGSLDEDGEDSGANRSNGERGKELHPCAEGERADPQRGEDVGGHIIMNWGACRDGLRLLFFCVYGAKINTCVEKK